MDAMRYKSVQMPGNVELFRYKIIIRLNVNRDKDGLRRD